MTKYLTNEEAARRALNGQNMEVNVGGIWVDARDVNVFLGPKTGGELSPYRAAAEPFTITVRGVAFDVPDPVRYPLKVGQVYWYPVVANACWHAWDRWQGDTDDNSRLERGLIHLTEAAAVTHSKAMCGVK